MFITHCASTDLLQQQLFGILVDWNDLILWALARDEIDPGKIGVHLVVPCFEIQFAGEDFRGENRCGLSVRYRSARFGLED